MANFFSGVKNAWNAFIRGDPTTIQPTISYGYGSSYRPDRLKMSVTNAKSIVSGIYTRIAIDVAAMQLEHARMNENNRFEDTVDSSLNTCLHYRANLDQTCRAFIQDLVESMLDEGVVAVVPVITKGDPRISESYDIYSMRVGKIVEWYPQHVRVNVYNEKTGLREDIMLPKWSVMIVDNPFYEVMNEHNSTLKRLIRKLNLLDYIDEQSGKNKLDLIIQLPYSLKTDKQFASAERRRKDIEQQLTGSTYGIAYIDSTEHITQLNRPVTNNLMEQVEKLTTMLYGQLGITEAVMNGTANEQEMLNYYNRTIEPIISAISLEMTCKFLSKTAIAQHQAITFFRDAFKLVPVNVLADIADKFTRNEITTSNEIRGVIGFKPSKDPRADELRNKNIAQAKEDADASQQPQVESEDPDVDSGQHY